MLKKPAIYGHSVNTFDLKLLCELKSAKSDFLKFKFHSILFSGCGLACQIAFINEFTEDN